MAAGDVFLSYRRADTRWPAAALYDRLSARLGPDRVFKDIDDIEPGDDFVRVLNEAVANAAVVLVLIGERWLDASDEHGNRRLDDPRDFVRVEVATALRRGIRVIPVLVDGAKMPRGVDLPDEIAPLARMQAIQIWAERMDVSRLLRVIEPLLEPQEPSAEADQRSPTTELGRATFGETPPPLGEARAPTPTTPPATESATDSVSTWPASTASGVPETPAAEGTAPQGQSQATDSPAPHRGRLILLVGVGAIALVTVIALVVMNLRQPELAEQGSPDYAVLVDPGQRRGYAATEDGIQVVDTATRRPLATISAGERSSRLALDHQTGRLHITDPVRGEVRIVDTATGRTVATWITEPGVLGIAVDADAGIAYLAQPNDGTLVARELASGEQGSVIELTDSPVDLVLVPLAERLYATSMWNAEILVVDTTAELQLGVLKLDHFARGMAADPARQRVYVSQASARAGIMVIDAVSDEQARTIDLPHAPHGLALDTTTGRLYVALDSGQVAVVDTATDAVVETIQLAGDLRGIGVDPGDGQADPMLVIVQSGGRVLTLPLDDAEVP